MFSIFLRRIQRILLPIKVGVLIIFIALLFYCFINVPPDIASITLVALILFMALAILFNFWLTATRSLLVALSIAFLLFLKATSLLTPLNLILFAIFLILLGLYLRKK
jgi:hypothetical protein